MRGKVQRLSDASRRRFVHEARSILGLCFEMTLTYGDEFPTDGRIVRKHWDAFRRWLIGQGVGGIAIQEFQQRGAPHRHVLLNAEIDLDAACARWSRIVGTQVDSDHRKLGVTGGALRQHPHAIIHYLAKAEQKVPPDGYSGLGRYWAVFGPIERHGVDLLVGTIEQVAPIIRVVRRLEADSRQARGLRVRRDRGLYGFTIYGEEALAALEKRLPDLLRLFGIGDRTPEL